MDLSTVARTVLLSNDDLVPARVVPAFGLLDREIAPGPAYAETVARLTAPVVALVDARTDLAGARDLTRVLRESDDRHVVVVVVTDGGFAGVGGDWAPDDVLPSAATVAEADARLRLAHARLLRRSGTPAGARSGDARPALAHGPLRIDPVSRTATLAGEPLRLTYLEFELLAHLARHPNVVLSRSRLLAEVWRNGARSTGRTVDVHVRRVRAALGEHADLVVTVRRVGYSFRPQPWSTGADGVEEARPLGRAG